MQGTVEGGNALFGLAKARIYLKFQTAKNLKLTKKNNWTDKQPPKLTHTMRAKNQKAQAHKQKKESLADKLSPIQISIFDSQDEHLRRRHIGGNGDAVLVAGPQQ